MASYSDLPVHLLEEILLRIDDAADLVRTSAACVSFRRIVTDGRFRRRFRLLHRPSVLGFLGCCTGRPLNFYPVAPPNRSAPAARALAQAADFSFSLLPDYSTGNNWWLSDIRDGRFLLSRRPRVVAITTARLGWSRHVFEPFVVYDPLHRQKVKIPPIPNDLLVVESPPGHGGVRRQAQDLEPFLLPAAAASNGEDHRGDPSFQLMCIVLFKDSEHAALVYSSATGKWRVMATLRNASCDHVTWWFYARRHYAHGCFYWVFYNETAMIKLDTHQMKFSIVDLPLGGEQRQDRRFIVEVPAGKDSRVGLLILGEHTLDLYSTNKSCSRERDSNGDDDVVGGNDWRHDNGAPLALGYQYWSLCSVAEGYALLRGILEGDYHKHKPLARYFTVEIKTLLVEQLCEMEFDTCATDFLYASFPPPFAPPIV